MAESSILTEAQVLAVTEIARTMVREAAAEVLRETEERITLHAAICPTRDNTLKAKAFIAGAMAAGAIGGGSIGAALMKVLGG